MHVDFDLKNHRYLSLSAGNVHQDLQTGVHPEGSQICRGDWSARKEIHGKEAVPFP